MRLIKQTIAVTGVALTLSLTGCGLGGETETTTDVGAGDNTQEGALDGVSVDVGSKDFDEQLILGQLTLLTLKAAGADVADKTNIQGSTQARTDLMKQEIDVYWDYTGTGWINFLGHDELITDAEEQYEKVKAEDLKENDLVWGERAPFNNTYSMAPTQAFAEENGSRRCPTWRPTSRRTTTTPSASSPSSPRARTGFRRWRRRTTSRSRVQHQDARNRCHLPADRERHLHLRGDLHHRRPYRRPWPACARGRQDGLPDLQRGAGHQRQEPRRRQDPGGAGSAGREAHHRGDDRPQREGERRGLPPDQVAEEYLKEEGFIG
jgi:hypothetical protein